MNKYVEEYLTATPEHKMEILQVLFARATNNEQRRIIAQETQKVYNRLRNRAIIELFTGETNVNN